MPVVVPTFDNKAVHPDVQKVIRDLANAFNGAEAQVARVTAIVGPQGRLSAGAIQQVRAALSATGSAPLDVTSTLGSGITGLSGAVQAGPGVGVVPATLSPTGAVPGSYGAVNRVPVLSVDASGRVVAITDVPIAGGVETAGYWSPLTNGDPVTPELIFADGDTIAVWTPTP